jgi:hypothetical protein
VIAHGAGIDHIIGGNNAMIRRNVGAIHESPTAQALWVLNSMFDHITFHRGRFTNRTYDPMTTGLYVAR